ncbi:four-jointed box protein 1-like [Diadema antillarum]|uniref:four-jointed box protein 1-like n=1 Tax=Diadema antillarum TaxID=105358 RepID=UPI003A8ADA9D
MAGFRYLSAFVVAVVVYATLQLSFVSSHSSHTLRQLSDAVGVSSVSPQDGELIGGSYSLNSRQPRTMVDAVPPPRLKSNNIDSPSAEESDGRGHQSPVRVTDRTQPDVASNSQRAVPGDGSAFGETKRDPLVHDKGDGNTLQSSRKGIQSRNLTGHSANATKAGAPKSNFTKFETNSSAEVNQLFDGEQTRRTSDTVIGKLREGGDGVMLHEAGTNARNTSSTAEMDSKLKDERDLGKRISDDHANQGWGGRMSDALAQFTDKTTPDDISFQRRILWGDYVENLLPDKVSDSEVSAWSFDVRGRQIRQLLPGCGRGKNRLAILDNGDKLCCRYRQNFDQIQGEILSFHLSRLLSIDNLPLAVLLRFSKENDQWEMVRQNASRAGWEDQKIIVATKWVSDLEPAYMPLELRAPNQTFGPVQLEEHSSEFDQKDNRDHLTKLAQWSDLVVFDYVTANLDRTINSLVNLQWNKHMLEQPVHNVEYSVSSNRLTFLDNESGMLHGYRMLSRYGHYLDQVLNSVCVFRLQTVRGLHTVLSSENSGWDLLQAALNSEEPLYEYLPSFPPKFREILQRRLLSVASHISSCQE